MSLFSVGVHSMPAGRIGVFPWSPQSAAVTAALT